MAERGADATEGGTGLVPGALSALLRDLVAMPDDGGAEAPPLLPGQVVGRYELIRELGRGGFGVVWEARDQALGRRVAFKAVRLGGSLRSREDRLLEEADTAARLQHPNLVTIFDVGRGDRGPYLVLELLHGKTLAERLQAGPLPVGEALRIARDIARGMAHAHSKGVVHRDLKPANVMVCDDGLVKVLDFGLSQAFGRRRVGGGTGGYMAPEQLRGAPEDERTDVFALGVILHELLLGRRPFPGDAVPATQAAPFEVSGVPSLGPLVAQMLRLDPVDRPRDVGEVLARLVEAEQELGSAAAPGAARVVPAGLLSRLRHRGLPRARLASAAVAVLLAGSALGALWAWRRHAAAPPPAPPSIAVLAFVDMSPGRDQGYLADGIAEEILQAIARLRGLKVVGRTSSFSFKGKDVPLSEIGAKLGVASILEGSVRKDGNNLRITAQLVRAADGVRLWGETYDRELAGAFAIQEDVARAVARSLRAVIKPEALPRPATAQAYEQYLRARHLGENAADPAGWRRAWEAAEKVVELDPRFAPGWILVALRRLDSGGWVEPTRELRNEWRRRGLEAVERAIALEPGSAAAVAIRSQYRLLALDWHGADADSARALELDPEDPTVLEQRMMLAMALLRGAEAIDLARRLTEVEPLSTRAWVALSECLDLYGGDRQGARRALEQATRLDASSLVALDRLALLEYEDGRLEEADRLVARVPYAWKDAHLVIIRSAQGRRGEAEAALARLLAIREKEAAYGSTMIAQMYAVMGRRDEAFAMLAQAVEHPDDDYMILFARSNPLFKALHADPRWPALIQRLGFPPAP